MERNWNNWLRAALIRALRTMAQSAAAILGTCALLSACRKRNKKIPFSARRRGKPNRQGMLQRM